MEALKTKWQTQLDQQLSKEGLAQIQQRLKDLQAKSKNLKNPSAIQSVITEIQALQKDIQTRIDTVQNFKKNLEADIRQAKKLASQIKDLPKKDFDRLRKKEWFVAPLTSSLIGSTVDTFLFFSISFYATGVPWVTLSFGDLAVKILVAIIMLIPFRILLKIIKPIKV